MSMYRFNNDKHYFYVVNSACPSKPEAELKILNAVKMSCICSKGPWIVLLGYNFWVSEKQDQ